MKLFSLILVLGLIVKSAFAAEFPVVVFETNKGSFEVELNSEKAPISVQNFLQYVDSGFYDQTIFHRVVKNFVVQGGGFTVDMVEKPTLAPIVNEAKNGLSNLKGTIGMARTEVIDSATSEFYFNSKDNVRLDYQSDEKYGYAVFGKIVSGIEVIDGMNEVAVHDVPVAEDVFQNVPVEPLMVISVKRKPIPNR